MSTRGARGRGGRQISVKSNSQSLSLNARFSQIQPNENAARNIPARRRAQIQRNSNNRFNDLMSKRTGQPRSSNGGNNFQGRGRNNRGSGVGRRGANSSRGTHGRHQRNRPLSADQLDKELDDYMGKDLRTELDNELDVYMGERDQASSVQQQSNA